MIMLTSLEFFKNICMSALVSNQFKIKLHLKQLYFTKNPPYWRVFFFNLPVYLFFCNRYFIGKN